MSLLSSNNMQTTSSSSSSSSIKPAILMQNSASATSLLSPLNLKQFGATLINSSIIIKSFCVCVLIGYLLSFKNEPMQYLSVIPGKLLPPNFFLWTLVTHSFIEYYFFQLVLDWFIILLYSKMLEPLWGIYECIQFYFITTVIVAFITSFLYFIKYALTFNEALLFNTSIHGLGGLVGGFSVAVKQIMPDTIILNLSFLRLRQDHLPLMLVLFSVLVCFILHDFTYWVMVALGILVGWVYLRFFQKHKNGNRGDSSSTFTFARFVDFF